MEAATARDAAMATVDCRYGTVMTRSMHELGAGDQPGGAMPAAGVASSGPTSPNSHRGSQPPSTAPW